MYMNHSSARGNVIVVFPEVAYGEISFCSHLSICPVCSATKKKFTKIHRFSVVNVHRVFTGFHPVVRPGTQYHHEHNSVVVTQAWGQDNEDAQRVARYSNIVNS